MSSYAPSALIDGVLLQSRIIAKILASASSVKVTESAARATAPTTARQANGRTRPVRVTFTGAITVSSRRRKSQRLRHLLHMELARHSAISALQAHRAARAWQQCRATSARPRGSPTGTPPAVESWVPDGFALAPELEPSAFAHPRRFASRLCRQLPSCDQAEPGALCEAGGECGTSNSLDNCAGIDPARTQRQAGAGQHGREHAGDAGGATRADVYRT